MSYLSSPPEPNQPIMITSVFDTEGTISICDTSRTSSQFHFSRELLQTPHDGFRTFIVASALENVLAVVRSFFFSTVVTFMMDDASTSRFRGKEKELSGCCRRCACFSPDGAYFGLVGRRYVEGGVIPTHNRGFVHVDRGGNDSAHDAGGMGPSSHVPPDLFFLTDDVVVSLAFSRGGDHFAYGQRNNGIITVCSLADGQSVFTIGASGRVPYHLVFAPNDRWLLSACSISGSEHEEFELWSRAKRTLMGKFKFRKTPRLPGGFPTRESWLSFDHNATRCAYLHKKGDMVTVMNLVNRKSICNVRPNVAGVKFGACCLSPVGSLLATLSISDGSVTNYVSLWNATTGAAIQEIVSHGRSQGILCFSDSGPEMRLVVEYWDKIQELSLLRGRRTVKPLPLNLMFSRRWFGNQEFKLWKRHLTSCSLSPCGHLVIAALDDGETVIRLVT